jgi:hypothetical protein
VTPLQTVKTKVRTNQLSEKRMVNCSVEVTDALRVRREFNKPSGNRAIREDVLQTGADFPFDDRER